MFPAFCLITFPRAFSFSVTQALLLRAGHINIHHRHSNNGRHCWPGPFSSEMISPTSVTPTPPTYPSNQSCWQTLARWPPLLSLIPSPYIPRWKSCYLYNVLL
jgi:hypothetical protein